MRKVNIKKIIIISISSLAVIGLFIFINPSLAKYADKIKSNHFQISSNFYFTSDYLEENEITYEIYTNELNVEVYNYDINNINDITSNEIEFTYNIKFYSNTDELLNELPNNNGTWTSDTVGKKNVITINNTYDASYAIVTVNSTSPYNKTLIGRFNFNDITYAPMYSVSELTNGFSVKIMTGAEDMERITISWPTVCGPDNTNPLMSSWTDGASSNYLTNLNANTTYVLNFYCNIEQTNPVVVENEILSQSEIIVNLE